MIFRDRTHAGRLLAASLEAYRAERPVVLGLARGGVPVAVEVARALDCELDVLVVRKLGAPGAPDYAVGALAEGGALFLRREALREIGAGEEWVAVAAAREGAEIARRVEQYRAGRPMRDVAGRTVIVVDDGVATGATARAGARCAKARGAARVVLAAPVIAAASEAELRSEFEAIVAVERPEVFFAVGQWYERFEQLSDEDVVAYLHRATGPDGARELERVGAWQPLDPVERTVAIPFDDVLGSGELEADLSVPTQARELVVFVDGSGSARHSPRNRFVARALQEAGFATLLLDQLTSDEAAEDAVTAQLRLDVRLLTGRLLAASRWLSGTARWLSGLSPARGLRLGYLGASTGAAAALAAAAAMPDDVAAVVAVSGRCDLIDRGTLRKVVAPVLLVVGGGDEDVLHACRAHVAQLASAKLAVVPGAGHALEEPGALGAVAELAARWFDRHLGVPLAESARV